MFRQIITCIFCLTRSVNFLNEASILSSFVSFTWPGVIIVASFFTSSSVYKSVQVPWNVRPQLVSRLLPHSVCEFFKMTIQHLPSFMKMLASKRQSAPKSWWTNKTTCLPWNAAILLHSFISSRRIFLFVVRLSVGRGRYNWKEYVLTAMNFVRLILHFVKYFKL